MLRGPLVSSAIAAVVVLVLSACGDDLSRTSLQLVEPLAAQEPEDVAPSSTTTTTSTTVPRTTSTTEAPDPLETLVATARPSTTSLLAYESPNGPIAELPFQVANPHQFGGPLTLMVTEGKADDEWVKVQLPVRPNGQEAWIRTDEYRIAGTRVRAEVDLSTTTVRVFDGDEVIAESEAVIGAENTPTPIGTFYVAAKRINPPEESYLGTWAVVLSSYSEVLPSFSGGLPVIAIHGTNYPDSELGQAISNGCVRVPNDVIDFMAEHVPLGAPVHISA